MFSLHLKQHLVLHSDTRRFNHPPDEIRDDWDGNDSFITFGGYDENQFEGQLHHFDLWYVSKWSIGLTSITYGL